jgi:hypothetical protein
MASSARRDPVRELAQLCRAPPEPGTRNLGEFIAANADGLAQELGVSSTKLEAERLLDDEDVAPRIRQLLERAKNRHVQQDLERRRERSLAAAQRLGASARWTDVGAELDVDVLLGGVLADRGKKLLAFDSQVGLKVVIPRHLVAAARLARRSLRRRLERVGRPRRARASSRIRGHPDKKRAWRHCTGQAPETLRPIAARLHAGRARGTPRRARVRHEDWLRARRQRCASAEQMVGFRRSMCRKRIRVSRQVWLSGRQRQAWRSQRRATTRARRSTTTSSAAARSEPPGGEPPGPAPCRPEFLPGGAS